MRPHICRDYLIVKVLDEPILQDFWGQQKRPIVFISIALLVLDDAWRVIYWELEGLTLHEVCWGLMRAFFSVWLAHQRVWYLIVAIVSVITPLSPPFWADQVLFFSNYAKILLILIKKSRLSDPKTQGFSFLQGLNDLLLVSSTKMLAITSTFSLPCLRRKGRYMTDIRLKTVVQGLFNHRVVYLTWRLASLLLLI